MADGVAAVADTVVLAVGRVRGVGSPVGEAVPVLVLLLLTGEAGPELAVDDLAGAAGLPDRAAATSRQPVAARATAAATRTRPAIRGGDEEVTGPVPLPRNRPWN